MSRNPDTAMPPDAPASRPNVTLVVAMARNRVIGKGGSLPWHLPADLAHFKRVTLNHVVIMGRKTFDSIRRPLAGRTNIVITRQAGWSAADTSTAHNLQDALELGRRVDLERHQQGVLMVIGGAEVFSQSVPIADRVELTLVDATFDGDACFPELPSEDWSLSAEQTHPADERNAHLMHFQTWRRLRRPQAGTAPLTDPVQA